MNFNERNPYSLGSLFLAVQHNSVDILRQLIKRGRNLDITDNRGWTPLHEAAALGHLDCLKVLLRYGARIGAKTHQGETAFFIACKYNRMEIVKVLLQHCKYFVDLSDNESVTPLHVSCTDNNLILAQFLIKNNANINAEDNSGMTPLQEAVMREDLEMCKLLLANGADLNSREYGGHLAFHFACMTDNIEIFRLLVDKGNLQDIDSGNCCGFTPLMLAVQGRCSRVLNELLNAGANVNAVDKSNTLALHLAVHTGNLDILKCILKATSPEAIKKYCTVSTHVLQTCTENESGNISHQSSLVSLVIDTESVDCLSYILNCGLDNDVLNCPIIESEVMPPFFQDMHNYALFGPHRNIEIEVNLADLGIERGFHQHQAILLHPISFLLKQKMSDLGKDTVKYLQMMLEHGFMFDCSSYHKNTSLQVIHPYEALMFCYQTNGQMLKDVVIDCLRLLIDFGFSVDYICNTNENRPIPLLFVYACRLPLIEIIPYLLQNSNLIDLDDLLRWVVHKIFMRIDPPPHSIENSLLDSYKYLTKYTPKSIRNFANQVRKPEYESRFNSVISFIDNETVLSVPSLKIICRSVTRGAIKDSCKSCPHQLKIRLNNLELPSSLLAFLNYSDMLESVSSV